MKIYGFFFFALDLLSIFRHCQATGSLPNILFIVCDDLNTHVSASNHPYISVPAFDVLADNDMAFERAFNNAQNHVLTPRQNDNKGKGRSPIDLNKERSTP